MLKYQTVALLFFCAFAAFCQDAPATVKPDLQTDKFADSASAEKLIDTRNDLIRKMQDERVQIIKNDKRAKEIHKQIMELSRELAILVDSKKNMRELNSELSKVDAELSKLPRKN